MVRWQTLAVLHLSWEAVQIFHFRGEKIRLEISFKHRKLMPLQRKKMHLLPLVFSTIIFLSHFSLLPYVSCSPMPGRQQGVYQHQGEPKEKCPELTYCDCVERNNKQRKLDITCNGVTSAQLKVTSKLHFSIKFG